MNAGHELAPPWRSPRRLAHRDDGVFLRFDDQDHARCRFVAFAGVVRAGRHVIVAREGPAPLAVPRNEANAYRLPFVAGDAIVLALLGYATGDVSPWFARSIGAVQGVAVLAEVDESARPDRGPTTGSGTSHATIPGSAPLAAPSRPSNASALPSAAVLPSPQALLAAIARLLAQPPSNLRHALVFVHGATPR